MATWPCSKRLRRDRTQTGRSALTRRPGTLPEYPPPAGRGLGLAPVVGAPARRRQPRPLAVQQRTMPMAAKPAWRNDEPANRFRSGQSRASVFSALTIHSIRMPRTGCGCPPVPARRCRLYGQYGADVAPRSAQARIRLQPVVIARILRQNLYLKGFPGRPITLINSVSQRSNKGFQFGFGAPQTEELASIFLGPYARCGLAKSTLTRPGRSLSKETCCEDDCGGRHSAVPRRLHPAVQALPAIVNMLHNRGLRAGKIAPSTTPTVTTWGDTYYAMVGPA